MIFKLIKKYFNKNNYDIFWVVIATIFGSVLRCYQLKNQILSGDEWHSIHRAIYTDYMKILTDFGSGGHSIPVAIYYKLLLDTIGLSEIYIYIPFLFSGILLVFILPITVRKIVNPFVFIIFAWLLSISPFLVFYSRFARPYGIIVLLGFCAITFFYKWWISNKRLYAIIYIVLGTLTVYFHIITLPFIFGPFIYFFLYSFSSDDKWAFLRKLIKMCIGISVSLSVFLGIPLINSFTAITDKSGYSNIESLTTIKALLILICGSSNMFITIPILLFISIAIYYLIKQYKTYNFYIYLLVLSTFQVFFIIIEKPLAANGAHIFARYIIVILPTLLLLFALGIEIVFKYITNNSSKQAFFLIIILILIFFKSPIPSSVFQYSNAANTFILAYLIFGEDYQNKILSEMIIKIPNFYNQLAINLPAQKNIVEVPYHYNGYHIYFYQLVHRQRVSMGFINGLCADTRLGEIPLSIKNINFKHFVYINNPDSLIKRKVDYVIFHKELHDEIKYKPEYQHQDVSECILKFQIWVGNPSYEDDDIIVYSIKNRH